MREPRTSSAKWRWEQTAVLPTLLGAGVGALGAFGANGKSRNTVLAGSLIGAAAGLAVWLPRRRMRATARKLTCGFHAASDRYWLARNPINYA